MKLALWLDDKSKKIFLSSSIFISYVYIYVGVHDIAYVCEGEYGSQRMTLGVITQYTFYNFY